MPIWSRLSVVLPALCVAAALGARAEAAPLPPPGMSALNPNGPLLLIFDDAGNGTISIDGGPANPLPGSLLDDPADPGCPVCAPVLTYLLPASEPVITGDVAVFASDGLSIADWLRFTDDSGDISGASSGPGARLIFYFDAPFPATAGLGSQNAIFGPTEVVSGSTATFDYQPAGVPYPADNQYIGSRQIGPPPSIPEPSALGLLGSCLAAMVLIALWIPRRTPALTLGC